MGEGQREKQTPHGSGHLMWDLIQGLWNHDLSRRQLLKQLSHPAGPNSNFYGFLWHRPTPYLQGVGSLAMLLFFAGPLSGKWTPNHAVIQSIGQHRAESQDLALWFSAIFL